MSNPRPTLQAQPDPSAFSPGHLRRAKSAAWETARESEAVSRVQASWNERAAVLCCPDVAVAPLQPAAFPCRRLMSVMGAMARHVVPRLRIWGPGLGNLTSLRCTVGIFVNFSHRRIVSLHSPQTIDFIPSDVATMGFQRHPSRTSSARREKPVSMPHIAGEPCRRGTREEFASTAACPAASPAIFTAPHLVCRCHHILRCACTNLTCCLYLPHNPIQGSPRQTRGALVVERVYMRG